MKCCYKQFQFFIILSEFRICPTFTDQDHKRSLSNLTFNIKSFIDPTSRAGYRNPEQAEKFILSGEILNPDSDIKEKRLKKWLLPKKNFLHDIAMHRLAKPTQYDFHRFFTHVYCF